MPDPRLAFLRSGDAVTSLPVQCSFTHRAQGADGEAALQYWPPKLGGTAPPKHLLLFILGNPALLDYYVPFLDHLYSLLPAHYAILSNSHIGHSPHLPMPTTPVDVSSHLASKIELVNAIRQELDDWHSDASSSEGPKLSLMGHSFGAWLLVETMKKVSDEISAGYMLFPSNGWLAETWNGRTTGFISTRIAQATLPTLSYLLRPVLPFAFPATTQSLLRSPATIAQCLATAESEFEHIREPDFDWFRAQATSDPRSGIFGIWSAGNLDGWVGREGPLIRDCLGGEEGRRVRMVDGIPHAFCLRQDHSELVAGIVASWLEPSAVDEPDVSQDHLRKPPVIASALPM